MATEKPNEQPAGDEATADSRQDSQPPSAASAGGSSVGSTQTAKCVYIFRNGDIFAPSRKFVLNRRQLRDWDVFLEQVTMSVNPLRGAVRNIVTPKRGRRRIQDLDSFDDKQHYVALARGERFKPMTYVPEGEVSTGASGDANASPTASPRKPLGGNRIVLEPIQPVVHNKKLMAVPSQFTAKMEVISSQSKAIRVYRNGDEFTPAIITVLRPAEQVSIEVVLRAVEEKVVLPNNMAIRKLYDLNGRRIHDPKQLQHEKHYVAAGREQFLQRPYGQRLPVVIMGKAERKSTIKYLSQPITPEKNSSRREKADESADTKANGKGASKADQAKSAGQIQTSIRGFQTRKAAAEKMTGGPVEIKPSAANSKKAKPTPSKEEQEKSASVIQASAKGFQARKDAASKLADKPIDIKNDQANSKANAKPNAKAKPTPSKEEQEKSASVIQASAKGFQARKQAASKLTDKPIDIKNDKANSKANTNNGKQQEQQSKKPMTEEEKAAAKSIQASVNSYNTRKGVAKKAAAK